MKRISLVVLAVSMLFASGVYAQDVNVKTLDSKQVAKLDVTGKWVGKRSQYSWDKSTFIEVFQYEFDLKQEGDKVTGTTTIITQNGEYADMLVEGVLVGNKLFFREYEVKGAIRPENKVWCFKSGELNFTTDGTNLKLEGATNSYMEQYNYQCSGGVTELTKVDNSPNVAVVQTTPSVKGTAPEVSVNVFPNPFVEHATVNYTLVDKNNNVSVEVFDMSGKQISILYNGKQSAGTYSLSYDATANPANSGMLIVKTTINGNIYSQQLVQMR